MRRPAYASLREAASDELLRLSKSGQLNLTLVEMQTIQRHFRDEGREPTDVELVAARKEFLSRK